MYGLLLEHRNELPKPLAAVAPRLVAHDWLNRCATIDGVDSTLRGLAGRLQRTNPLAAGAAEIKRHAVPIEAGFLEFFPQALEFAESLSPAPRS